MRAEREEKARRRRALWSKDSAQADVRDSAGPAGAEPPINTAASHLLADHFARHGPGLHEKLLRRSLEQGMDFLRADEHPEKLWARGNQFLERAFDALRVGD